VTARHETLNQWLAEVVGGDDWSLAEASSDASFRRYWRLTLPGGTTRIVMDAPPPVEDCGRFVALARRLRAAGLNTPEVYAENHAQGFLLLTDLGTLPYLGALDDATVDRLYGDALAALATLQARVPSDGLPEYDAPFLRRELHIFREWYLEGHLGATLGEADLGDWERACAVLVESALEQPRVCVHRDFHSRNLMVDTDHNPGILDFQDAVLGPVTYDLVSLLRDCYIAWDPRRVRDWALGYRDLAVRSGILPETDPGRFLRWMDLMGIQRHLKAAGIFARLDRRDAKPHYLGDIPRTLGYVREVAAGYPELSGLLGLMERHHGGT
jgi:aminoglycoside/choline kinase family phosphotransferase